MMIYPIKQSRKGWNFSTPVFLSLLLLWTPAVAQPDLSYYLPDTTVYDSAVPTPAEILGHEVGEYHVSHDRLVQYMMALDKASDRITLTVTGHTHERRPLLLLTITTPENHRNIESIRNQHRQLTDPSRSSELNTATMPAVFYLGCSIHGNEASGSNAGMLIAYHLAASQDKELLEALRNTIVLFDPSFNPDGLQRFASWVNSRKSQMTSSDPNDMEHHEAWPGGRSNHYWFDLNRDWLVAQHPESQARIKIFHEWKPNLLTDHHEMGTNSTFFFQPGVPSRSHPLTPAKNIELTKKMGEFHAKALDQIGSLYYTQESYDDFYYGKGSTFPDAQGAVGILFEQASSRGHQQDSDNGVLTFPFTIRNQFTAAMSSLKAVNALRADLLNYQRQFFKDAIDQSRRDPVKALIFGSARDKARATLLAEIIARQDIAIYRTKEPVKFNGKTFEPASSFIVPMSQPQYILLKSMFEKRTQFQDSLFYDISSWTLSLASGVEIEELKNVPSLGEKISEAVLAPGTLIGSKNPYAYVFESHGYYAPRAIYRLLEQDVRVKVSTDILYSGGRRFERGAIMIPVTGQEKTSQQIEFIINEIVRKDGLDVYAFDTGLDYQGISLGSDSFKPLKKPKIAMLAGDGITSTTAGEMWHLLDTRFQIPVTMLPVSVFNSVDINKYNTLIFPPGAYGSISEPAKEKLKEWILRGGVAIGLATAINWFQSAGLGKFEMKKSGEKTAGDTMTDRRYADIANFRGAQVTSGAILEATADLTHPLLYGYYQDKMPVFKGNNLYMEKSKNGFANPLVLAQDPLMSGYISKENFDKAREASLVGVSVLGQGRIIGFTDNLAFRAFWFGTNKLLMNAIFYGPIIHAGSAR